MHELRCPNCRMRLWLYQGMHRDIPPQGRCPSCSGGVDRSARSAASLTARIAGDHELARRDRDGDDVLARPPLRPGASR